MPCLGPVAAVPAALLPVAPVDDDLSDSCQDSCRPVGPVPLGAAELHHQLGRLDRLLPVPEDHAVGRRQDVPLVHDDAAAVVTVGEDQRRQPGNLGIAGLGTAAEGGQLAEAAVPVQLVGGVGVQVQEAGAPVATDRPENNQMLVSRDSLISGVSH